MTPPISTETTGTERLPLWRLIAGVSVLGSFALVLALLTPVYLDDLQLYRYLKTVERSANTPDETLRAEVIARAHELDLPVHANDVHVVHTGSKTKIEMRYTVRMDIALYPVDLHFPTIR